MGLASSDMERKVVFLRKKKDFLHFGYFSVMRSNITGTSVSHSKLSYNSNLNNLYLSECHCSRYLPSFQYLVALPCSPYTSISAGFNITTVVCASCLNFNRLWLYWKIKLITFLEEFPLSLLLVGPVQMHLKIILLNWYFHGWN